MNNAVDSSAWVEYFIDGPNAAFFASAIENTSSLVVPSISLHEVFKKTLQNQNEGSALRAIAQMKQGSVRDLDEEVALSAAKLSFQLNLPMVESIVLATARVSHARLWTQEECFRGIEGVNYKPRARSLAL